MLYIAAVMYFTGSRRRVRKWRLSRALPQDSWQDTGDSNCERAGGKFATIAPFKRRHLVHQPPARRAEPRHMLRGPVARFTAQSIRGSTLVPLW